MSLEHELIDWLQNALPASRHVAVGIGDDAAVLSSPQSESVVVTTDLLTDGVDFLLDEVDPQQIGHKALGVNLSDLAAMAAQPGAMFVSLALPQSGFLQGNPLELAKEIYRGMFPLLERHNATIAGGDTNTWDAPLAISITAIGQPTSRGPLTRSGAQAGDQLLVTGKLGGSILGRHLAVEPRVEEAILLHERYTLHAAIDISDGLALDVSRLATSSNVGAVLDLAAIPIASAAERLSRQDKQPAIDHALGDGEDFELVLAVAPEVATKILADQPLSIELTHIGELIDEGGLWQRNKSGQHAPLAAIGYQHSSHT